VPRAKFLSLFVKTVGHGAVFALNLCGINCLSNIESGTIFGIVLIARVMERGAQFILSPEH